MSKNLDYLHSKVVPVYLFCLLILAFKFLMLCYRMTSELDVETTQTVSNDIRVLRENCIKALNIIENSPLDTYTSSEDVTEKALNYVEGLRTEILNSSTPITTDENLLTAQFLNELKEKTTQVKEFSAFLAGSIFDVDSVIDR